MLLQKRGLTSFTPATNIARSGWYPGCKCPDGSVPPEYITATIDRKSTRLNSSHLGISYAVFCLKKKPNIQIMVVTVGAITKKDVNNLYKDTEKTGGEKPIALIKATKPILIVDEPQ